MKNNRQPRKLINDKSATYNFKVIETLECGIILTGQETKSIIDGGASMKGGRIYFDKNEVYLSGLHVTPFGTYTSDLHHNMDRIKKLLAHKKEIKRMQEWEMTIGNAIVPLSINLDKNGRIKVIVGLCVGMKKFDKREKEKKKEANLNIRRELSNKNKKEF